MSSLHRFAFVVNVGGAGHRGFGFGREAERTDVLYPVHGISSLMTVDGWQMLMATPLIGTQTATLKTLSAV